jgi:hypothetical protein
MDSDICTAIRSRKILEVYYDGGYRNLEPYCYGLGISGNDLLRAYQLGEPHEPNRKIGWKLFKVEDFALIALTNNHFEARRTEYNPKDCAMKEIYCAV